MDTILRKVNGKWKKVDYVDAKDLDKIMESAKDVCSNIVVVSGDGGFKAFVKKDGGWVNTMNGHDVRGFDSICESVDSMSNDRKMGELVSRIARTNLEKKYMAEANLNESPSVGLFWIDVDKCTVYGDAVSIRDGVDYGDAWSGYVIHPSCHYDLWPKVRNANPSWKDERDYEMIPRGRVIFSKENGDRRFIVYMSPLANSPRCEAAVRSYFSLPSNTVFKYDDEHYQPIEA